MKIRNKGASFVEVNCIQRIISSTLLMEYKLILVVGYFLDLCVVHSLW